MFMFKTSSFFVNILLFADDGHVASITGLPTEAVANGTEITFSVTAESGYEVSSVSIGNKALVPTDGKYTFTVAGDMEIVIATKVEGAPEAYQHILDTTSSTEGASGNSYTGWSTYTDAASYAWIGNGNFTMNPWRIGAGKSVSMTNEKRVVGTSSALPKDILSLEIGIGTSTVTINSITVEVYSTYTSSSHEYSTKVASYTTTATQFAASTSYTFTKEGSTSTQGGYLKITFDLSCTGSSSGAKFLQLSTITLNGPVE